MSRGVVIRTLADSSNDQHSLSALQICTERQRVATVVCRKVWGLCREEMVFGRDDEEREATSNKKRNYLMFGPSHGAESNQLLLDKIFYLANASGIHSRDLCWLFCTSLSTIKSL